MYHILSSFYTQSESTYGTEKKTSDEGYHVETVCDRCYSYSYDIGDKEY